MLETLVPLGLCVVLLRPSSRTEGAISPAASLLVPTQDSSQTPSQLQSALWLGLKPLLRTLGRPVSPITCFCFSPPCLHLPIPGALTPGNSTINFLPTNLHLRVSFLGEPLCHWWKERMMQKNQVCPPGLSLLTLLSPVSSSVGLGVGGKEARPPLIHAPHRHAPAHLSSWRIAHLTLRVSKGKRQVLQRGKARSSITHLSFSFFICKIGLCQGHCTPCVFPITLHFLSRSLLAPSLIWSPLPNLLPSPSSLCSPHDRTINQMRC